MRSGPEWPVFQKEGYCFPVQDKLPPLASEDSLAKDKTALSSLSEGTWSPLMIANQVSTTRSKGLERNLLVLLPAPSFPLSGMFPSLRASQTPAFLRTAQESEYIPFPVIWMGRDSQSSQKFGGMQGIMWMPLCSVKVTDKALRAQTQPLQQRPRAHITH